MTTQQRMSDERLAEIKIGEFYMPSGWKKLSTELLQALKAERVVVERVELLPKKWRKDWSIKNIFADELEAAIHTPPKPKE